MTPWTGETCGADVSKELTSMKRGIAPSLGTSNLLCRSSGNAALLESQPRMVLHLSAGLAGFATITALSICELLMVSLLVLAMGQDSVLCFWHHSDLSVVSHKACLFYWVSAAS